MRAVACLLVAVSSAALMASPAAGQVVPPNAPAVAAARARQEKGKTLEMVLKKTEVVARGAVTNRAIPSLRPEQVIPKKEMTAESRSRLVITGEKYRIENNHPSPIFPIAKWNKTTVLAVFNGATAKMWFPQNLDGKGGRMGIVARDARIAGTGMHGLAPLRWTVRGMDPVFCHDTINKLNPSGATLAIEGAPCQECRIPPSQQITSSYWLDPKKDYVIRRFRSQSRVRVLKQIDVRYQPHAVCGWVPVSWVCKEYSPEGAVLFTSTWEVLDLRINADQPSEQFEFTFPPQTWVYDQSKDKHYRVQADGTMRELASPNEEEVPGDSTVSQPGDSWDLRNQWLLLSLGLAVWFLALAYVWRRMARKAV
jgi:hypothetical protein